MKLACKYKYMMYVPRASCLEPTFAGLVGYQIPCTHTHGHAHAHIHTLTHTHMRTHSHTHSSTHQSETTSSTRLKTQLSNLATTDPAFYRFLQVTAHRIDPLPFRCMEGTIKR